jgi:hypothetical protein
VAASPVYIRVGTPEAGSQGGARAKVAMSGGVAKDAARCDWNKLRLELYKQSTPATGTVIGHFTGRVIWDAQLTYETHPRRRLPLPLSS